MFIIIIFLRELEFENFSSFLSQDYLENTEIKENICIDLKSDFYISTSNIILLLLLNCNCYVLFVIIFTKLNINSELQIGNNRKRVNSSPSFNF